MKHIEIAEFMVTQGEMQAFTSAMQTWGRLALHDDDGPEQHMMLVSEDNACRVTSVAQFATSDKAAAFKEKGLADELVARVQSHCDQTPVVHNYSLYYEAGPDGPDIVFGQDAHHGA